MRLTERQIQVLELMAEGAKGREISKRLAISPHTVKNHRAGIYNRLGAVNAEHAIAIAISEGIIKGRTWET